MLTPVSLHPSQRLQWSGRHRYIHLILTIVGFAGAALSFLYLEAFWLALCVGAGLTFLYTAPKMPGPLFSWLRRIAVGKTLFLALVWTYVTCLLPCLVAGRQWQSAFTWFAISRFMFIYAICILFDLRDRDDDRAEGIRSLVTYLSLRGVQQLYFVSLLTSIVTTLILLWHGLSVIFVCLLLVPVIICFFLYSKARGNYSDYFFYLWLDGLMMLSALLLLLLQI